MVGGGDLLFLIRHAGKIFHLLGHGKIHVRLTGREPDFADEHVSKRDGFCRVVPGDGKHPALGRLLQRFEVNTPLTLSIRRG